MTAAANRFRDNQPYVANTQPLLPSEFEELLLRPVVERILGLAPHTPGGMKGQESRICYAKWDAPHNTTARLTVSQRGHTML